VTPDFCEDTITYTCEGVTGPDAAGNIITYAAGTYPNTLCTLAANELSGSATAAQYTGTTAAT